MIINEDKVFARKVRISVLEIMQVALRLYARTGNEKFLQQAKEFGVFSDKLKKV